MDSAIKLKLLHEDLSPKVERKEMKAREPSEIIVLKAEENFNMSHLKAPSTSNFIINIGVEGCL